MGEKGMAGLASSGGSTPWVNPSDLTPGGASGQIPASAFAPGGGQVTASDLTPQGGGQSISGLMGEVAAADPAAAAAATAQASGEKGQASLNPSALGQAASATGGAGSGKALPNNPGATEA